MAEHVSSGGEGDQSDRTRSTADADLPDEPPAESDPLSDSTADLLPGSDTTLNGGADSSADQATPRPAERFGDYELLEEIARGGMGIVYKARHLSLNRIVALKVIRSGRFSDEEERRRFQIEAEAAAQLDHPHIIPVYEVGSLDGQSYFTMAYVEGRSLEDYLREGPLPPREAADLLGLTAAAIHYAHQKGVIHRDLKPSNVLLSRRMDPASDSSRSRRAVVSPYEPRVTDFGLALRVETSERLTVTGQILGTPNYMSPEQAAGKTGIGPSTDVYSLGAMLYRMLTGRPPFRAATVVQTLQQVQTAEPQPPRRIRPGIPLDLETICLCCLSKEPSARYATAGQLAEDLERFLVGDSIRARPTPGWERFWKWGRRRPALVVLGTVLVTSLIIGGLALEVVRRQRAEIAELKANLAVTVADMERSTNLVAYGEADFFDPSRRQERLEAIDNYERLIPILERRVEATEESGQFRALLAQYHLNLGALQLTVKSPQTESSLQTALQFFQQLSIDEPANVDYLRGLATSRFNLGEYFAGRGRLAEAEAAFDLTLHDTESLPADQQRELRGRTHLERGLVFVHQGMLPEAERDLRDAEPILTEQLATAPGDIATARQLGRVQYSLGLVSSHNRRLDEAKEHYERALQTQEQLVKRVGSANQSRHDLAQTLTNYGQILWQSGDIATAGEHLQRAVSEARIVAELAPSDKTHEILGRSAYHRASYLFTQQKYQEALPLLQDSLQAFTAIEQDPAPDLPALRHLVRSGLVQTWLQLGEHQQAFEMVKVLLPDSVRTADELFFVASYCARCAALAAQDEELNSEEQTALQEEYGDLAVEILREAVDAGFADAQKLRTSQEWSVLQNRGDVQQIAEEIGR